MKEKLTKNLGIKLLSIPLAAIIWIVIINIDDPISSKVIYNVPVEILNESYITASGQVYDIVEGSTVSVTIRAKRTIRDKIKAADLRVTANLAEITRFNRVEIVAECTKYSSDNVEVTAKPKMLTVTLEDRATKTLPINVTTTGVVDSGYYVDSVKASPNMLEIRGAESTIERVSEVRVSVDVSGHQENFRQNRLTPKLYDEKGREIDSSRISFSHSNVTVKATILPTKMVPIQVNSKGTLAPGYTVSEIEYGPEQVELAGLPEVLSKISSIPVEIDVENASQSIETDIDLIDYLPKNTKLVGDTSSIAVRVTVVEVATKNITLREEDIELQNLADGYSASISTPYPIVVVAANGNNDLNSITAAELGAYINLEGLDAGTHSVEIRFTGSEEYQISGTFKVNVVITQDQGDGDGEPTDGNPTDAGEEDNVTD